MFAYTLNQIGQQTIIAAIEKNCPETVFADAFFSDAEFSADENGGHIEIGSQYTFSGNPVFVELSSECFDAEKIDE